jgi:hypothetical protein
MDVMLNGNILDEIVDWLMADRQMMSGDFIVINWSYLINLLW